jgi:hypothetical protein
MELLRAGLGGESESGLGERRSGITAANDRPRLASHHIDSATLRPFNTTNVTRSSSITPLSYRSYTREPPHPTSRPRRPARPHPNLR